MSVIEWQILRVIDKYKEENGPQEGIRLREKA
jgi:hypothetical protein